MVALSVLTYSRANSEIISAQTKHVHKLWVIAKACTGFSLFNSVRCNFIRSFSRIKLSGCLLTYRNFEDTGLCNTSMILLSHCVNPLKWAYRKSIIPLELTVKPSFQAVEDKTPFSYWENFDSSFFFPTNLRQEQRWREVVIKSFAWQPPLRELIFSTLLYIHCCSPVDQTGRRRAFLLFLIFLPAI